MIGAQTWGLITHGLPEGEFVNVVREDPVSPGLLYAGTDWGVFVSLDDGADWQAMPLDEPRCENPPFGAVIDYTLPRDAAKVELRILDAKGKEVASYSSDTHPSPPDPSRLNIVPIWVRRPQTLGVTAGAHRYTWGFSDRTAPGDYTIELTVDGKAVTKKLKVVPDPRSKDRR